MGGVIRALLVVIGLALVGPATAGAAGHSGVSVRITRVGPCAVPGPRCDTMGIPATIRVERARSRRLVRTVHAGTGRARIRLRPGRYRLLATADGGTGAGSAIARVERRRFTAVVVRLQRP
jgi:hypothetical protein